MYITLFIIAIILGIFLLWLIFSDRVNLSNDIGAVLLAISIVVLAYGLSSALILTTKKDLEYDMNKYLKAKTEIEILNNESLTIPMQVAYEYYDDISSANKLVMDSRKYHDNWYLKQFYYKEIAELPLLEIDSVEIKVSI